MSAEASSALTQTDKRLIRSLLELKKASTYTLAKNADTPYASMFASMKKLESLGLVEKLRETESKKGGRKIIYALTPMGREHALKLGGPIAIAPTQNATESVPNPLDDIVTDFVLSQRRETAELDFKLTLDTGRDSDFAEIAKDIFAMSNYGGGYLVIGFAETKAGTIEPVGLASDFHIDQAQLQEKFNSYSNDPLAIDYKEIEREVNGEARKFALIYVPPSTTVLKPIKYGVYTSKGKVRKAFSKDEILIRRGTQSIHASQKEIEFVQRRARETEYRIGLLEGKPDRIRENLYANFFETIDMPNKVFEAELPRNVRFAFFEIRDTPFVRSTGESIYSFSDLGRPPFGKYIRAGSLHARELPYFQETQDRRILLTWLLNREIRHEALKKGLRYDPKEKNVYFYPTGELERHESWEGRFKKSTRLVARKLYIKQQGTSLYAHVAASISFRSIGSRFYLKILPKIILTHNGYDTIRSFREGTIKTRLSYNQYNDAYLNLILFWASRFKSLDGRKINFGGRISVSSQPITVTLNVGIKSDRSSEEFSRSKDELYSFEAMEVL
jgi:DNA-binding PadR family transcriptional regulator